MTRFPDVPNKLQLHQLNGRLSSQLQSDAARLAQRSSRVQSLSGFIGGRPASNTPLVSFADVVIKFKPRNGSIEPQELHCTNELASCNRQCEHLYGTDTVDLEEPCKLAVASHFVDGPACFPASAFLQDRSRGTISIADVRVGDEVAQSQCGFTEVVALLHVDTYNTHIYIEVSHACGKLYISPQHFLRLRSHRAPVHDSAISVCQNRCAGKAANRRDKWIWSRACDMRPGDELQDGKGETRTVHSLRRVCLVGAYAPLTQSGEILVDGVLCSCFAPPRHVAVPHELCHAAMLPLRVLYCMKTAMEQLSRFPGFTKPIFTVDALWLLPKGKNKTLHPWPAGLLFIFSKYLAFIKRCKKSTSFI